MANPSDNQFCRRCGHRLADDIVEGENQSPGDSDVPTSPVPGVEIKRYPLVDPEDGQEIELNPEPLQKETVEQQKPPKKRSSVILWSLGIHLLITLTVAIAATALLGQFGFAPSESEIRNFQTQFNELRERNLSPEATERELEQLFERYGMDQYFELLFWPMLIAFFLSGFLAGRYFRPEFLFDVGIAGFVVGGLCAMCLLNIFLWPLAATLSFAGALLGKRWGN